MSEINFLGFLLVFLSSSILASILVPLLRKIAFRLDVIDRPNQKHKTHIEPVPYLGGFSIVIPTVLLSLCGGLFIEGTENYLRLLLLLMPSLIISIVGFIDDSKNLPAQPRFIVQLCTSVTASIILVETGFVSRITNYKIVDFLISIFWIVGLTNAFNFIDNLDGGAAGISFITAASIFLLGVMSGQYLIAILSICIAGSTVSFLYWNISPARIYLGDGGALFLGIIFSILLLQFEPEAKSQIVSAVIPIFMVAVPIIDTTVVVTSRLRRGVPVFQGGRDHLSHRIQKLGFSRKATASILWSLSVIFSTLGLLINLLRGNVEIYIMFCGLILMMMIFLYFLIIPSDSL